MVYDYPETGDVEWGPEATDWAAAITSGTLQKAGGLFQLLAEVDFGTTHGIKSLYYKSRTATPATAGQIRFAQLDTISWRNAANSGNLDLTLDGSDNLIFNGVPVVGSISVLDTDSIDLTYSASVLSADVNLSAAAADAGFINAVASIEADGLQVQVSIADTSTTGVLTNTDWNTFNGKQAAGNYITALTGDVVATGPGSVAATIQPGVIVNSMISASAAIAFSKLATLAEANILIGSAGGVATAQAITGDISLTAGGVTAYAGTVPLNKGGTGQTAKAPAFDALSPMSASGDIIYGGASGTGTRLIKGSDGQVLTLASGLPSWAAVQFIPAVRAVTTTDTATIADNTLKLSGASFTETLFTAVGNTGRVLTIQHTGTSLTQVYTLATAGGQTIGGVASGAYALYTNGETLVIQSDGANWIILDHKTNIDFGTATTTITASSVNPTKGTTATDSIRWWRIGKYIRGYLNFIQTGAGAAGTGVYYIATLANVTPDTTYINYNTLTSSLGTDLGRDSIGLMPMSGAGSFGFCAAYLFDATKMTFKYARNDTAGSGGPWGSAALPLSSSTCNLSGYLEYPVSGWQP